MNAFWGGVAAAFVGVCGIVVVVAADSSGYASESEYVKDCVDGISSNLSRADVAAGCKCMYRSALPVAKARGDTLVQEHVADQFFDKCKGGLLSRADAQSDWKVRQSYEARSASNSGWDDGAEASGWGD